MLFLSRSYSLDIMYDEHKYNLYQKIIKKIKKLEELFENKNGYNFLFWIKKKILFFQLKKKITYFIDYLINKENISFSLIEDQRIEKNLLKGGFLKKIYVDLFGVLKNNELEIEYFYNNIDRYHKLLLNETGNLVEEYVFFSCHKLVRDNTLEVDGKNGNIIIYKILSDADFQKEAIKKLEEELKELFYATKYSEIVEEISDLKDIFDTVLKF